MEQVAVSKIMTTEVVTVSPDQKLLDIKHIYQKSDFHHHIPVVQDGRLVGMVSLVDFMYRIKGAGLDDAETVYHNVTVGEIMSPNPYSVSADTPVDQLAAELAKGRYRAIPVLQDGRLAGIVSTADIIRFLLRQTK